MTAVFSILNSEMYNMKNVPIILLVLLSSCIRINDNRYRQLSEKEVAGIRPFTENDIKNGKNTAYVSVKGGDIKEILKNNEYSWVMYWVPYCTGPACRPLFYYDVIANKFPKLRFVTISQTYDMEDIGNKVKQADYKHDIYFPLDAYYGHKMFRARKQITAEIIPNEDIVKVRPTHMIFKGEQLIYHGLDISAAAMDSILKAN